MKHFNILTHNGIPVDGYTIIKHQSIKETAFPRLHPDYKKISDLKKEYSLSELDPSKRSKVLELLDQCKLTPYTLSERLLPSQEKPQPETAFIRKSEHRGCEITTEMVAKPSEDMVAITCTYSVSGIEYTMTEECKIGAFPFQAVALESRVRYDITVKQSK